MKKLTKNSLISLFVIITLSACSSDDDEGIDIGDPCELNTCLPGTWQVQGGGEITFNGDGTGSTTSDFFYLNEDFKTFTWVANDNANTFTTTFMATQTQSFDETFAVSSSNTNQIVIDRTVATVTLTR